MPSATTILLLRACTGIRREESHALAVGLRSGDPIRVDKARELRKQAEGLARKLGPAGRHKKANAAGDKTAIAALQPSILASFGPTAGHGL